MPATWPGCALCATVLIAAPATAQPVSDTALSFADALALARDHSAAILTARAQVEAAKGRAIQAGVRPNPEVRVDVEGFAGSGPYSRLGGAETTVGLAQTFELGGKRGARVRLARAELAIAELDLAISVADTEQQLRDAFAQAIAAQTRLELAKSALDRAQDVSRAASLMVDAGKEPPLRGMRARTAVAEAQAAIVAAKSDLASRLLAVASLLGRDNPPSAVMPPVSENAPVDWTAPTATLDYQRAALGINAAQAKVSLERSRATPDVTVGLGGRHYQDTGDNALVLSLSAPLPVNDRNQGNIAAAHSDEIAAQVKRKQALIAATQAQRDARARLAAAVEREQALDKTAVPQAREALRLARIGYRAGKFALLDVLDAQSALNTALENLTAAKLEKSLAASALRRATR